MGYRAVYLDIAQQKGDVVVNPLSSNKADQSRFTRALLQACQDAELDETIAKAPLSIGTLFVTPGYGCGFSSILHVVSPFEADDPALNLLRFTYLSVCNKIKAMGYQQVTIPLLGIDTNGYSNNQSFETAISVIGDYSLKNPKMDFTLAFPAPGDANEKAMAILAKKVIRPVNIVIDERKIHSYWDYFLAYIAARKKSGAPIDGIANEAEFSHALYNHFVASSTMAHWKGLAKSKDKKSDYYPVPGKSILFLICLLLDMSYEEAKNCFFYFGYGLSVFNPIDAYYLDILKNPRDEIDTINDQLIKQFGSKQGFWCP
jgi:O-acetyl-ADP-ribose deacetylase (regulator of RNase III)